MMAPWFRPRASSTVYRPWTARVSNFIVLARARAASRSAMRTLARSTYFWTSGP